ncbi:MAG: hypothetical protein ABW197_01195 [Methyloceanibacter sp.]
MRSCALIALASVTALALSLPCAAEEPARTSSVAKQTAPQLQVPSLLAPPQAATASSLPTRASPVPSDAPASSVHAAARPTEVKTETYMRPPVPAVPAPAVPVAPQTAAPSPPPDMTGDAQASRERDGGFTSPDQLMDWISNYRDHKEPWRVPAAVHAMNDFGLFGDEEKAWFCIGFIAGVLGSNPKDGPSLVPKMFPMPDKEQAIIIRAIVYSGRPDWRELLEKNSSRMPLRRPLIDDFLNDKRPTLMTLPLDTGGSPGIYALWGYYVATGQHEPVVRIMEALRWSKTKADSGFSFRKVFSGWGRDPSAVDKITTGGTAKWTLASYAERDRQLLALYRAESGRQPEEIAVPLKDVIKAAEDFESEKVRKDQFGAIEDAQRQKLSNEAGMTKGATAGSIAIATGCVAASALGQAYIALPCVIGGALYTGAVKLAH